MATELTGFQLSLIAGADLSAKQFTFVKAHSTAGQVVSSGAGETAIGVLEAGDVAGRAVPIRRLGVAKVKAGGIITAGALVAADAAGEAVAATATDFVLGTALAGAADGDIIEVALTDGTAVAA